MSDSARDTLSSAPPIFVVGAPRSGTTLVRMMLDSHHRISCGPESHFLIDLRALAERHERRFARFGNGRADVDARVRSFFEDVHVDYMTQRGRQRWADKTPRYTLHLEYIDRLFPEAQHIHVIRDGRDVVASHRERWGYRSAVKAAGRWVHHVEAAQRFGRGPAADRCYEVRYEELVREPEPTLRPLFEFLGEPWDPNVLAFHELAHDADRFQAFTASRREQSGDTSAIYTSRVGAGTRELDPFLRALTGAQGGRLLRELGYRT